LTFHKYDTLFIIWRIQGTDEIVGNQPMYNSFLMCDVSLNWMTQDTSIITYTEELSLSNGEMTSSTWSETAITNQLNVVGFVHENI